MSGELSTLILKVDLSCCECNKKIKKLLCKIQDRENIRLIAYDEKNNTVTISGPFDPPCLKRKLYRKACKIIKDINIPPPPPEKKPDPDPPPEKKPDPDPPPEKKPDPPKPVCCTQPCYVGMFGGMKCASCGMVYTWTNQGPPPVMVHNQPPVPRPHCYDGYGYGYGYGYGCNCGCGQSKTCNQFICEYNTSQCTIM